MSDDVPRDLEAFVAELRAVPPANVALKGRVLATARGLGIPRRPRLSLARPLLIGLAAALALFVLLRQSDAGDAARPVPFVLMAPTAVRVSIVGDFNDWDLAATPLRRAGEHAWWVVVQLRPGRYRYSFVVDGTRWVADPSAPRAADNDFGAESSVVTILGGHRL